MNYSTAKVVFGILLVVGWLLAGVGALFAVSFIGTMNLALILPWLYMLVVGFLLVAAAQIGLAQIATAEYTYAIWALLKSDSDSAHNSLGRR